MSINEIDKILIKEVGHHKAPSVQYYFFNQDSIIKSFQLGYADIVKQKKVSDNSTYNAFSVTKTFTALAILQLVEKGEIDLSKPVNHYLSEFLYGEKIMVKHLLNHSSGIPNPIPLSWIHLEHEHEAFEGGAFFQPIFEKFNKVKSNPNEKFSYSNLGYVVLGQLIEKVSGKMYEEYVKEEIIQKLPIHSNDLTFVITDREAHAKGYHKKNSFSDLVLGFFLDKSKFMDETEGRWRSFNHFYVNGAAYGGLIGKATAFVTYIQELLKDESSLISDQYKHMLFQENRNNRGKNTGMCMSWFQGEINGEKYFSHPGGGGGYYCEIRIYPERKMGSVIFFNRTGMTDERFLDRLDIYNLQEAKQ